MRQEVGPSCLVDGGVFNRGVGENQGIRINLIGGVGGYISDKITIRIAEHFVECPPRAVLSDTWSGQ